MPTPRKKATELTEGAPKMAMPVALKQNWVRFVRSNRFRTCQYHLSKEGFTGAREYTPLGVLIELAEIPFEMLPCTINGHRSHKAMAVQGEFSGVEGDTDELVFQTFP